MKPLLTVLSLGILASTTAQAGTAGADIQEVITKYESSLNASNTDAVMELYGSNPIFMPQHAPAQEGRTAVKQAYDNVFNSIKLDIKFTTHEVEVLGDTCLLYTSPSPRD